MSKNEGLEWEPMDCNGTYGTHETYGTYMFIGHANF